jgi:hypothetical protein
MTAMLSKRVTIFVLAVATLVFAGGAVDQADAQGAGITVEGGSFEVAPDSAFTFDVTGHAPGHTIGAFSITVAFDPDVLTPLSCQSSTSRCNKGAGEGELIMNSASLLGWTGDIHFGTIVFQAVGNAGNQTPVDMTVTAIADVLGFDLDHLTQVNDGSVSIRADATNHPLGDANCDSDFGPADGLAVLEGLAGVHESECLGLGDVNCDDRVDSLDTLDILRLVGGLDVELPAGCPEPG